MPKPRRENPVEVTQKDITQLFDDLTESYHRDINKAIAFGGAEHGFYIDVKRDHLVRLTGEVFPDLRNLDVVDVGCGLGAYHPRLEGRFRQLHGVDISTRSVELAAARHPFVQYQSYDGDRLPYSDDRFDMAFAVCVMHHVPQNGWPAFVSEMSRVLKPGGLALIFEHNPYNPATQYIVKSCEIDRDAVLLKPFRLRQLFDDAGFEDVSTRTILSVPPRGRFLTWLDGVMGNLPFGAQYYLAARKKDRPGA